MGTKLCLAAADTTTTLELFRKCGVVNALGAYYYIRKRPKVDWPFYFNMFQERNGIFLVDSGAFTFKEAFGLGTREGTKAGNELKGKDRDTYIQEYLDEYIAWVKSFGPNPPFEFIELDIDEIIGKEPCDEFRARMVAEGLRPVPVWHGQEGMDTFAHLEELCRQFPFVAISIIFPTQHVMSKIFTIAKRYKTKLHGLAMTDPKLLVKFPFYTVDSSSWLAGVQYGITYEARGRNLLVLDKDNKNQRKRMKTACEKAGVDYKAFLADNNEAVNHWNVLQWVRYNEETEKPVHRDYWLEGGKALSAEVIDVAVGEAVDAVDAVDGKSIALVEPSRHPLSQEVVPKLRCNSCIVSDRCPARKEDSYCAYEFSAEFNTKEGIKSALVSVMQIQFERVGRGAMIERLDGGALDKQVSAELQNLVKIVAQLGAMSDQRESIEIKAKGPGVFAQIFGGLRKDG